MMNNTKPKLEIRTKPKPTVQVNKSLILVVAAILIFLVIWAITSAFTQTNSSKKDKTIKLSTDKPMQVSGAIKDIPENYHDMNAITKYLGASPNNGLDNLQKEFANLKSEHEALMQQMLAVTQARQRPTHIEDSGSQQAKTSGLFFGGIGSEQGIGAMGGGMIQNVPGQQGAQSTQPVPPVTPQQAAYFKQQGENTQKLAVMKAIDNPEDIYDLHNMVTPASPYEVQAGTIIPSILITRVDTSVTGIVVAQVRQSVFDSVSGKFLLIPKGSKLLGEYEPRTTYGQRRVLIAFNRIIRPDGSSILLGKFSGSDLQGAAGMYGDVDDHWGRILGAATLSTILAVGAGVWSDSYAPNNNRDYPSNKQNAISSGAGAIANTGQTIVNKSIDIPPTITLPAGYEFNVIVKKDMVLTPFKCY